MNIPIKDAEERIAELEAMVKDRDALRHRVEGYISSEVAHIREINALKAENERLRSELSEAKADDLEWMTHFYIPLSIWKDEVGLWVVEDKSTGVFIAGAFCASEALKTARKALEGKEG